MISLRTTTHARNLTVLAALLLSTALTQPALSDGGRGGYEDNYSGAGGTGASPDGGDAQTNGIFIGDSGGGGAMSYTTGNGGRGGNGAVSTGSGDPAAQGGIGGGRALRYSVVPNITLTTVTLGLDGGDGANGTTIYTGAGGGGAGGASVVYGYTSSGGRLSNNGSLTGGAGGNGGVGGGGSGNYSVGGGGEGGVGVLMLSESTLNNSGRITGGFGGHGGQSSINSAYYNGEGGDGGHGVLFLNGGIVVNSGTITGGDAGLGGGVGGSGPHGSAGSAIYGAGLTVTNSGTLSGGLEADGTYSNAITFTGGTNALELRAGSTIIGNVDSLAGSDDVFALGGSTNGTFDISTIGASAQYRGFEEFEKRGSSNWTLTGDTASTDFWLIDEGGLYVNGDTSLNMVVDTNGTLGGSGSIGNASISGTLAPGNSIWPAAGFSDTRLS